MSIYKKIEKTLDQLLIHKKLHENFEELGKARFVIYALVSSSLFVAIYTLSLEFSDKELPLIKSIANYFGVGLGISCIIAIRRYGSISLAVMLNLILGAVFVVVSAYFSGGLLSVDIFWLIILTMISFLFVSPMSGLFMTGAMVVLMSVFYFAAVSGFRNYWADNQESGLLYEYLNLLFLLIFAALLVYFYVSGTTRIKKELTELKEKQIQNLGDNYKYITDNVTDIIAIHLMDGATTYISPAIEKVLGFKAADLLGKEYSRIIQFSPKASQKTISCVHKNGETIYLEVDYSNVTEELEGHRVIISIARNVTDKVLEDQKIGQLREQLANDFHDEMGNKLAAITLSSNLLSLQLSDDHSAKDTLSNIEETSKSLYQNSRDFIWSIESKSDRLDEIFFYLKDFAEDLLQNLPLTFRSEAPSVNQLSPHILQMYAGRHLVLIFKEAITNAIKHSQAKSILLKLSLSAEDFTLELQDDGIGFPEDQKKGKGLDSMQKRSERIACVLSFISTNRGTTVQLTGKLPNLGGKRAEINL